MFRHIAMLMGCVVFSASAFADPATIRASNNQLNIQTMSTNVDYKETGNGIFGQKGVLLDTEQGDVPGYGVSLSAMSSEDNLYFEAAYDHAKGQTSYIGGLASPPTPYGSVVGTSSATLINYNARFGRGFLIDEFWPESYEPIMLTPYLELGHHSWGRGVNFGENYTNDYVGIGGLLQFSPASSNLVISLSAMVGNTVRSKITVNGGPGLGNGFSGTLGTSTIGKYGISADYAFTPHAHGTVGVDWTTFNYGASGGFPIGGSTFGEPDSSTSYVTIKVGLGVSF